MIPCICLLFQEANRKVSAGEAAVSGQAACAFDCSLECSDASESRFNRRELDAAEVLLEWQKQDYAEDEMHEINEMQVVNTLATLTHMLLMPSCLNTSVHMPELEVRLPKFVIPFQATLLTLLVISHCTFFKSRYLISHCTLVT